MRKNLISFIILLMLSGCAGGTSSDKFVYQRSIADLNTKAQELLQAGDPAGAIGRLESAYDLDPDQPITLYNLGIAYHQQGDLDKSLGAFEKLLGEDAKNKQLPVERSVALKSLGVVYEAKGDQVISTYMEAKEKANDKEPVDGAQLKTDAIGFYKKAQETYEKSLEGSAKQGELRHQIEMISKRIEEIESGKVSNAVEF